METGESFGSYLLTLDQDLLQTTATLPLSVIGPKIAEAEAFDESGLFTYR